MQWKNKEKTHRRKKTCAGQIERMGQEAQEDLAHGAEWECGQKIKSDREKLGRLGLEPWTSRLQSSCTTLTNEMDAYF